MGLFENTYIYGSNQWLTLQNKRHQQTQVGLLVRPFKKEIK